MSSTNFRSLTEGSLDVQSFVYREKSSRERTQPWGAPVLIVRVLDENFPASLPVACLSRSWWSTDRRRWGRRAVSVYSEECPGWWCLKRSWSLQTGSSHKSLVYLDAAGWSAVPCWLRHPQTCLLCRQTAGGPVRVQWRPSDKPKLVFQIIS